MAPVASAIPIAQSGKSPTTIAPIGPIVGLGVQAPTWDPATGANDLAVTLLLNPLAGITADTIAAAGQVVPVGGTVTIAGYASGLPIGLLPQALRGTAVVSALMATTYQERLPPGPNFLQAGDSGGPTFGTFMVGGNMV